MTTIPGLDRMLGDRIRAAINDPSRYTDRRHGHAENPDDVPAETHGEWATRAVVLAIERGLFENDCRLVPGKTLFELEQRAGQAQAPIPGPHSAADGPTAPPEGSGGVETPNGTHRGDERPCPQRTPHAPHGWAHAWPEQGANAGYDYANRTCPGIPDERNDAGLLAFIVRDLMDAAGYDYSPDRPLAKQARECDQMIHRRQDQMSMLELGLINEQNEHAADVQRLTDLADELRKQLAAALRVAEYPTILAWRRTAAEMPTPTEWNDLIQEGRDLHDRVDSLDRLLQERDTLIEAACPCKPGAPAHEHLTGGYALTWMSSQASDLGDDPDGDLDGADYPPFPSGSRP